MTKLDDLIAKKQQLKAEIIAKQEELHKVALETNKVIEKEHIDAATKAVKDAAVREGRTPEEQAAYWLANDWADAGRHVLARRFLDQKIVNARDLGLA